MKKFILVFALIICCSLAYTQTTIHQYRKVAPENMAEYLDREVKYWSVFAENEVKKGNLTFWAVLQKVGGINQENAPNILLINTFNNLDEPVNWSAVDDLFPDVKMEDIQTWSLSANTDTVYLRDLGNHVQGESVNPEEDFNYVKIVYHNSKNTGLHLDFEENKWKPMIQKAMNEGKTPMKGWGNAGILHPSSARFPFNSMSYDLFTSLNGAFSPALADVELEDGFFSDLAENEAGPRTIQLYRIVKIVSAQ